MKRNRSRMRQGKSGWMFGFSRLIIKETTTSMHLNMAYAL